MYTRTLSPTTGSQDPHLVEAMAKQNALFKKKLHDRPEICKIIEISLIIFGTCCLIEGIKSFTPKSIVFIFVGTFLISFARFGRKLYDTFIPSIHNRRQHAYEPSIYSIPGTDKTITLGYEGDLPVLNIPKGCTPYEAGFGQAYLMASQIHRFLEKNRFAFHTIGMIPRPDQLPDLINKIRASIPKKYIDEMRGYVDGYNEEKKKWLFSRQMQSLTLNDLIFCQLIAEMSHFDYKEMNIYTKSLRESVGCTFICDGNKTTGPCIGRNLDFPTLSIYSESTFIINYEENGVKITETRFPCSFGTVTGMNQFGFCVAMNVCQGETDYPEGIPAVIYNRMCLTSCKTVQDAEAFVKRYPGPLGPFHLSIADENTSKTIHFYQGAGRTNTIRQWDGINPFFTTNLRYGPLGTTRPWITNSRERVAELNRYFEELKKENKFDSRNPSNVIATAIRLHEVNNILTVHCIEMHPRSRTFKIAINDGWAGCDSGQVVKSDFWLKP